VEHDQREKIVAEAELARLKALEEADKQPERKTVLQKLAALRG
jgi:hypothetical protein